MSCIVVIPIYKDHPSPVEKASIQRTCRVLSKHDIAFVTHEGCLLDDYKRIVGSESGTWRCEFFDKQFFEGVAQYSTLCLSEEFYLRFEQYDYMLICQPDAWVFRDELDYWCEQGYDYIGAPVYFPIERQKFTRIFYGVGNGGFSLRRISYCMNAIRKDRHRIFLKPNILAKIYWYGFLYNTDYKRSLVKRLSLLPLFIAKVFGFRNTMEHYMKEGCEEDAILSFWGSNAWGIKCRVPDECTAARFSMEVHPQYLYEKTGCQLPFGCHAFEKWEYESFWKKHIEL